MLVDVLEVARVTGLEALARVIPVDGEDLTMAQIEMRLYQLGVKIDSDRLERILRYLVLHGMVTRERERYRQVRSI